jgi:hypothetical protein
MIDCDLAENGCEGGYRPNAFRLEICYHPHSRLTHDIPVMFETMAWFWTAFIQYVYNY